MSRYLVTGGAGFIGSHLVEALIGCGHRVTVLDDFSTGRWENVEHMAPLDSLRVVDGSVCDTDLTDALVAEADVCVHLASAVGVRLVVENPLETLLRTAHGVDSVMAAAARHGRRLLYASTSEVYGRNDGAALHEESPLILGSPFRARWSYAIAKCFGEALAHGYHRDAGAEFVVVRLFNTVGPRQSGDYGMVLPRFVRQALTGQPLTVYGDGSQTRCFTHVFDTVAAMLQLCENDRALGQVFNVGNPVPISIATLAARVAVRANSASRIVRVPYESAYAEGFEELGRRQPDISRLQTLTGWRPRRTLDHAIDDVVAYERAQRTQLTTLAADAG